MESLEAVRLRQANPLLTKEGRREAPGWSLAPKHFSVSDHPSCAFSAESPPL